MLLISQSSSIIETSPSDRFVSYLGHSLGRVLLLCRESVCIFYSISRLGKMMLLKMAYRKWILSHFLIPFYLFFVLFFVLFSFVFKSQKFLKRLTANMNFFFLHKVGWRSDIEKKGGYSKKLVTKRVNEYIHGEVFFMLCIWVKSFWEVWKFVRHIWEKSP